MILSIDFGTTNSLAGAWGPKGRIEALDLDHMATDPTLFRTLLYFKDQDSAWYGQEAIEKFVDNQMEGRLFRSFKTHLSNRDYLGTYVGNRVVTLESMIGFFLLEIKKRAEQLLQTECTSAVIGRPARYSMDPLKDEFAKYRMQKAAEIAGFKHIEFMPEPLAAALEYRRHIQEEKLVLVADFGGGTSDFTVLKVGPREFSTDDVLSIDGCPLAGDSMDSAIMKHKLSYHFGTEVNYKVPLGSNILKMPTLLRTRLEHPAHIVHLQSPETYQFLKNVGSWALGDKNKKLMSQLFVLVEDQQIFQFFETIEACKRTLSQKDQTLFEYFYPGIEVREEILRTDFNSWIDKIRSQIIESLDRALASAQVTSKDIDVVFMTGGTAKVPAIASALEERFGRIETRQAFHSVLSGLTEAAGRLSDGKSLKDWK